MTLNGGQDGPCGQEPCRPSRAARSRHRHRCRRRDHILHRWPLYPPGSSTLSRYRTGHDRNV